MVVATTAEGITVATVATVVTVVTVATVAVTTINEKPPLAFVYPFPRLRAKIIKEVNGHGEFASYRPLGDIPAKTVSPSGVAESLYLLA